MISPDDPNRFRILISYHYFRNVDLDVLFGERWPGPQPEVFADSGAYSAMTQEADVQLDEYADWLHRWRHWFATAANLDVIGDGSEAADGTWANQQALEDKGLQVLPVFHAGEPWDALERYLDAGYPYLALGGLVGRPVENIMPWLVRCFRMGADRAVFHGFGLTSWRTLSALPWYSVDSSSWGAGFRWGAIRLFDDQVGKFRIVRVGHHRDIYNPHALKLLRAHGADPAEFANRERFARDRAAALGAVAWRKGEDYLRRRHGPVVIPDGPDGVRWFNAVGNNAHGAQKAAKGLLWFNAEGSGDNLVKGAEGLKLYLATVGADLDSWRRQLNGEPPPSEREDQ